MAEEMSAEEQAAALEGFLDNPVAVGYAKGHSAAMQDLVAVGNEVDEQLRELLSYCETSAGGPPFEGDREQADRAYSDVANRLRNILDGE